MDTILRPHDFDLTKLTTQYSFCFQAWGVKAIWSPHTGIVDWALVTEHYGKNFRDLGGSIYLDFEVKDFSLVEDDRNENPAGTNYPVRIISDGKSVRCKYVLTCGGLQSDKLAKLSGCNEDPRIVPFRGEYLLLKQDKAHLVRGNIYPVSVLYIWSDIDLRECGILWIQTSMCFQKVAINICMLLDSENHHGEIASPAYS
ncbi:L-2-hydroxyglutarate dehydrogenase, mitochondrial [Chionoecetes opilio]|uniref:L-2-hydroxyglutarate dehydrogenase, mitochondrial n=1 Tax=Chionoecetes opilio TaxID=41210 RepID=A0A8J5D117_CHIOP|nr:L-2-hydroxyglutarate dehydrogenase, mitochondrial [Chionoecetes opilio]